MMENPFDQFDAAAAEGNPFDQFDEPTKPLKLDRGAPSGGDSTTARSAAGAAMGVADLGNTVLNAVTAPLGKLSPKIAQWNRTRNADMEHLTEQNKDSTAFNVGRVGGNIAATLPVGGAAAAGVRTVASLPRLGGAAPQLGRLANSIASGGMRTGSGITRASPLAARAGDMATRAAGGAITGGASAGLVDPEHAGLGAGIGAALPGVAKVMGAAGAKANQFTNRTAQRLMQSAIKPTIDQLRNGEAKIAIDTLLEYGINPTMKGTERLRSMIGGLNDQIADKIATSGATVSKKNVVKSLDEVKRNFSRQVSPTSDLRTIQGVSDDFMAHPSLPGDAIPVTTAQEMKQGTYRVLKKKYGQIGSAETEAQKGLARGLKEEIAGAVPGVRALNAQESRLISTLSVAERRAYMEMNKNPMGLAALASSPASWAAFMVDKSALFKSLAARAVNSSGGAAGRAAPRLTNSFSNPLLRNLATVPGGRAQRE